MDERTQELHDRSQRDPYNHVLIHPVEGGITILLSHRITMDAAAQVFVADGDVRGRGEPRELTQSRLRERRTDLGADGPHGGDIGRLRPELSVVRVSVRNRLNRRGDRPMVGCRGVAGGGGSRGASIRVAAVVP